MKEIVLVPEKGKSFLFVNNNVSLWDNKCIVEKF